MTQKVKLCRPPDKSTFTTLRDARVAGQRAVAAGQCATGLRLRGPSQRPGWAAAAMTGAGCAVTGVGICRHNEITENGSTSLVALRATAAGRLSGEARGDLPYFVGQFVCVCVARPPSFVAEDEGIIAARLTLSAGEGKRDMAPRYALRCAHLAC